MTTDNRPDQATVNALVFELLDGDELHQRAAVMVAMLERLWLEAIDRGGPGSVQIARGGSEHAQRQDF